MEFIIMNPKETAEEYRPIKGYWDRYGVNRKGEIKNIRSGRILKTRVSKNGYVKVNLFDGKKQKTFFLHRIVLVSFSNEQNVNIRHKDGNKLNNKLDNLIYDHQSPFNSPESGVSHIEVVDTKTGEKYSSIREASEKLNINYANLSAMLSGWKQNLTQLCRKVTIL